MGRQSTRHEVPATPLDSLQAIEASRDIAVARRRARVFRVIVGCGVMAGVLAAGQPPTPADLSHMDVEDLMNVKVTSVSKREQKLSRTAAAVFVIGPEDIRRSGATSIPDLLRIVPGVDVRQIDANAWAISIRGFSARYSNKVL